MGKLGEVFCGVKTLDCTLRDGALVCDSRFPSLLPKKLVLAAAACGVDIVELGFKSSEKFFPRDKFGALRFCDEEYLQKNFAPIKNGLCFSAMIDVLRADLKTDIKPRRESVLDILRVCAYFEDLPKLLDALKAVKDCGYKSAACLMAVSTLSQELIDEALGRISQCKPDIIYLMDSFGALMPQDVERLSKKYLAAAQSCGAVFGAHFHNNMQLAFANSIVAARSGAGVLDSCVCDMGKGAGNCLTEQLLAAKFGLETIRPMTEFIAEQMNPLKGRFKWGYRDEYAITALANLNSKVASNFLKTARSDTSIVDFYDGVFKKS